VIEEINAQQNDSVLMLSRKASVFFHVDAETLGKSGISKTMAICLTLPDCHLVAMIPVGALARHHQSHG